MKSVLLPEVFCHIKDKYGLGKKNFRVYESEDESGGDVNLRGLFVRIYVDGPSSNDKEASFLTVCEWRENSCDGTLYFFYSACRLKELRERDFSDDKKDTKAFIREMIDSQMRKGSFENIYKQAYIREKKKRKLLGNENKRLEEENVELMYRPSGPGALEALRRFEKNI
ncbi:hypothetical protein LAU_0144 [Lausannevirus]|uniref:Uncharacterized protein n=1 Tax=Lausannevirus TaxID=999883 RepID=F2WL72_9VIRU|nr:hypothetical protein LAU_0144 [Lausannevirus]AEA06995.1 hypothetical protein LAU_0144 [Lausannevirus]